jgi:hypothetical protein
MNSSTLHNLHMHTRWSCWNVARVSELQHHMNTIHLLIAYASHHRIDTTIDAPENDLHREIHRILSGFYRVSEVGATRNIIGYIDQVRNCLEVSHMI